MATHVTPKDVLSKEFFLSLRQKKKWVPFWNYSMLKVLEQIPDNEMDSDLGYEKHSLEGINNDNSHNSKFPKKIQTEHGKAVIDIPRNRKGEFEPIIAPKHQSRGLSIELV